MKKTNEELNEPKLSPKEALAEDAAEKPKKKKPSKKLNSMIAAAAMKHGSVAAGKKVVLSMLKKANGKKS